MSELIFLEPHFKEVLWGGNKMREAYGYDIPGDDTGEAWVVSTHPAGPSVVKEGPYKGMKLDALYEEHRELFGNLQDEKFPLLIKIIDAKDDLSIQVHPDDAYASEHENGALGKTECWYILDAEPGADIVVGHHAKTRDEMAEMIDEGRWDEFLNVMPIKKGDFFYIPAGTLHAIRKGTLILETQQNSDVTYRVYDYGRLQNGKPRELHLKQSKDVITVPQQPEKTEGPVQAHEGYTEQELVENRLFTVEKYIIDGEAEIENPHPFLIVDVIGGEGDVDGHPIKAGDHFIVPSGYEKILIRGDLEIITSHI